VEDSENMVEIKPLTRFSLDDLKRIATGYTSTEKYVVHKIESAEETSITLKRMTLDQPYVKRYDHDDEYLAYRYLQIVENGLSSGAYDDEELIGLALVEHQQWNNALLVWEFHIASSYRGRKIGTQLMEQVIRTGLDVGARMIICETQNTNAPAIHFYRKAGFEMDAVDLSLYTNTDVQEGEVAVFMKNHLMAKS
jgi:ribosomal protein S18 acetylase RimI-like enzyme